MLLGYVRATIDDDDLARQRASLISAGCHFVFEECPATATREMSALLTLLGKIQAEDVVVVTSLSQLARSTAELLKTAAHLRNAKAGLRSLTEPWADTTQPAGWMVFAVLAGITQFEQTLSAQKTVTGRIDAKSRGVKFGRPSSLAAEQIALGRELVQQGTSVRRAAALVGCHYASLYRALAPKERQAATE